jgi:hypothetical protein
MLDSHISEIDRLYRAHVAARRDGDRGDRASKLEARRLWAECSEAKVQAMTAFAALNGWKRDDRGAYDPEGIGHRNRRYLDHHVSLFDHCVNFRADGKNVAVVTQPYHYRPDEARRWADQRGLAVHLPPDPLASIHYPGATYFIVIVAASDLVKWLPDQDGRLADRWAARAALATERVSP